MHPVKKSAPGTAGFTLVELMVAMTILVLICIVLASITQTIARTWTSTTAKIEQFRQAREGFESMTRRLSQATLNTYWDYELDSNDSPRRYTRQSELRFISGPGVAGDTASTPPRPGHAVFFQAPLGYSDQPSYGRLANLLNTWGYFIEFNDDSQTRPPFVNTPLRNRFRLTEMSEPSEKLTLYKYTSGSQNLTYKGREWFQTPLDAGLTRVVAENVIALVIRPRFAKGEKRQSGQEFAAEELAPNYGYDSTTAKADREVNSKNQLPPVIEVAMVAIDEAAASRMDAQANRDLLQKVGSLFTDASSMEADLHQGDGGANDGSLEAYLIRNKISYRIFNTSISLKSAKWSREQEN